MYFVETTPTGITGSAKVIFGISACKCPQAEYFGIQITKLLILLDIIIDGRLIQYDVTWIINTHEWLLKIINLNLESLK